MFSFLFKPYEEPERPAGIDELLWHAMLLVTESQLGSTSMLQRKLGIGFAEAGEVMELLEEAGVVGPQPHKSSRSRDVLMGPEQLVDFVAALEAKAEADRAASQSVSGNGGSIADEIAKLGELAQQGVITQEEFSRGKELFLGRAPDEAADQVALLRQLHGLWKSGVLSESEFNMKKWDLLSSK